MASFWSRLQIPSLISSKENGHQSVLLRGSAILQSVVKENIRSFWFWKPKKPVEYGTANCGEPPQKPIVEPCRGCPSKCLEEGYGEPVEKKKKGFFGSKKKEAEVIKEKPSNCEEVKPVEEKLTWWEMIFGPDPKRSWPDPCTCRLAHRQKKKCRAHDPRLRDPRFRETAGDVFLYTEVVKRHTRSCQEPQPKPPPSYKVPKAVLFKNMCDETALHHREMSKTNEDAYSIMRPFRIPYEEMRPPGKKRQMFSCQRGIRSEDVLRPTRKDSNVYRIPSAAPRPLFFAIKKKETPVREAKSDSNRATQKRSRVEQLKFLIQQRDTLHCASSMT